MTTSKKKLPTRRVGGRSNPILSDAECKEIASAFDGSSASIDALWEQWKRLKPGLKRHNVGQAARRGGYQTAKPARRWITSDDRFLRDNWHLMPPESLAEVLGRSLHAVLARRQKLGIRRSATDEFTPRGLQKLTGINSQRWHSFIEAGLLASRNRPRRKAARPITFITVASLHGLLKAHPEIYDYRSAPENVRALLQLDNLPDPPARKWVRCMAERPRIMKSKVWHKASEQSTTRYVHAKPSCRDLGGTAFWAPIYARPQCPRCGCQVSSFATSWSSV
jgi:hypothetical protein